MLVFYRWSPFKRKVQCKSFNLLKKKSNAQISASDGLDKSGNAQLAVLFFKRNLETQKLRFSSLNSVIPIRIKRSEQVTMYVFFSFSGVPSNGFQKNIQILFCTSHYGILSLGTSLLQPFLSVVLVLPFFAFLLLGWSLLKQSAGSMLCVASPILGLSC